MSRFEEALNHIESGLRAIIEGGKEVDGIPRKFHNRITRELESSFHKGVLKTQHEDQPDTAVSIAPDQYILILPPDQARLLLSHPGALDHLAQKLAQTATEMNISLLATPMLRVVASPTAENLIVHTEYSHAGMDDSYTAVLDDRLQLSTEQTYQRMPKAFLIVNGVKTYPISDVITNIGRHPDNQLVLDDPSISRRHAQLRLINQRFTIFDLDSSRGTFVNGKPVVSQVLNPGDVIQLASIPLVYGHEMPSQMGLTQEI